jgi:hypothetical protein
MDMLQKLPIEILYLVVQQLDLREAAFVARTCQGLATKLKRYLYHRIDVPAFRDAGRLGEIRRFRVHRPLASTCRTASYYLSR